MGNRVSDHQRRRLRDRDGPAAGLTLRIGVGDADQRRLGFRANRGDGQRTGRSGRAYDDIDIVFLDRLARINGRVGGIGCIVKRDQPDLFAADLVLEGESRLHALVIGCAEGGNGAGHGGNEADHDLAAGGTSPRRQQRRESGKCRGGLCRRMIGIRIRHVLFP